MGREEASTAAIKHGNVTTASAAALQLTATDTPLQKGVEVSADTTNAGVLYVGSSALTAGSAAATDGFPLSPGARLFLPVDNLTDVWFRAAGSGYKAHFIGT